MFQGFENSPLKKEQYGSVEKNARTPGGSVQDGLLEGELGVAPLWMLLQQSDDGITCMSGFQRLKA